MVISEIITLFDNIIQPVILFKVISYLKYQIFRKYLKTMVKHTLTFLLLIFVSAAFSTRKHQLLTHQNHDDTWECC